METTTTPPAAVPEVATLDNFGDALIAAIGAELADKVLKDVTAFLTTEPAACKKIIYLAFL